MSQHEYTYGDFVYANGVQCRVVYANTDNMHGNLVSLDVRFSTGLKGTFGLDEIHTLSTEERLRRIEERLGLDA